MKRRIAVLGFLAPIVWLGGSLLMSYDERLFMDRLGWDVWPSGLSLGPDGWGQIAIFLLFAALYITLLTEVVLAAKWGRLARMGSRIALGVGSATPLLAFNTDPMNAKMTWHGALHAAGYLTLLLSMLVLFVSVLPGLIRRAGRAWRLAPLALLLIPFAWTGPNSKVTSNYLFFAVPFTLLAATSLVLQEGTVRREPASER
ncbi:MAG: hypothetical protein ABJA81_01520 [Nocardioidaceae bacterium]